MKAAAVAATILLLAASGAAWEFAEHESLGDRAFKDFIAQNPSAEGFLGSKTNSFSNSFGTFSFGRMVGLWADIWGNFRSPIYLASDPKAEFLSQFDEVMSGGGSAVGDTKGQWPYVERAANFESNCLATKGKGCYDGLDNFQTVCNLAHATLENPTDCPTLKSEGDFSTIMIKANFKHSRFLDLADANFDHFGFRDGPGYFPKIANRIAYLAAHKAACEMAQTDFKRAMMMEAASIHYLSDMFASGHIRTPRRQMSQACKPAVLGNLMAKCPHDEDNKLGLYVKNDKGNTWKAYGDGSYALGFNDENAVLMNKAVVKSMEQILKCRSWNTVEAAIRHVDKAVLQANLERADQHFGTITAKATEDSVKITWQKMPVMTGDARTILNLKYEGQTDASKTNIVKGQEFTVEGVNQCTDVEFQLMQDGKTSEWLKVRTLGCGSSSSLLQLGDDDVKNWAVVEDDQHFGDVHANATSATEAVVTWEKMPHMHTDAELNSGKAPFATIVYFEAPAGSKMQAKIVKEPKHEVKIDKLPKCTEIRVYLDQDKKQSAKLNFFTPCSDSAPAPKTAAQAAPAPHAPTPYELEHNEALKLVPSSVTKNNHNPMFDVRLDVPKEIGGGVRDAVLGKRAQIKTPQLVHREPLDLLDATKYETMNELDCPGLLKTCRYQNAMVNKLTDIFQANGLM